MIYRSRELQDIYLEAILVLQIAHQNVSHPTTIFQLTAQLDRNPIYSAIKPPTRLIRAPANTPQAAPVDAAPALDEEEDGLAVAELVGPVDLADAESVVDGFPVDKEP